MGHDNLSFLDEIVRGKSEKIESKAKSYYLEVDVTQGIKILANNVNKTESQFVNELLKAIVEKYLDEN